MRILHYFLGFHRAGGLNRYAADLALTQVQSGHEVFALVPVGSLAKKTRIVADGTLSGVRKYKLLGGRPIPLLLGIRCPEDILDFAGRLSAESIQKFCDEVRADIFHIHTWMGFPDELLSELKRRNTKIVFTTHDYFGLCPKVNFIDDAGHVCCHADNERCSRCNADAPSPRVLALRNNIWLLGMKKMLRPFAGLLHRNGDVRREVTIRNFEALKDYYVGLLEQCDIIHCNSEVSAGVYRRFVDESKLEVIPITHCGITDCRCRKSVGKRIELLYSGPAEDFKGLPLLLDVLNDIYRQGIRNWRLNVWGQRGKSDCPAIIYRGIYTAKQNADVFGNSDLLVVPSVCNETFGFVVPEALMYGTPVLCSDKVGAQLLVPSDMVYHDVTELRSKLEHILQNGKILDDMNAKICASEFDMDMSQHAKKITDLYGIRQ